MTSSFTAHSLSGVPTALGDVFAAATYLPVAKMMDVWGRAEGFLLMVICLTIGLVLMATCDSFGIYCAANVSSKEDMLLTTYTDGNIRSSTIPVSTVWNTQSML